MAKYISAPDIPRIPVIAGLVALIVYTVTRLGLTLFTGFEVTATGIPFKGFNAVPVSLWPEIFLKGFWFDVCVVSVLVAPICLYEALLTNSWRAKSWHQTMRLTVLWLAMALLLFGAAAELGFWLEFSTRLNVIALDSLRYTSELIGTVRESYPVGQILAGIGALASVMLMVITPAVKRADSHDMTLLQRICLALFSCTVPALMMYFGNVDQMDKQYLPMVSEQTVRQLPKEVQKLSGIPQDGTVNPKNAYAAELSGNGLFTIAAAQRRSDLDYDKHYRAIPQPQANTALVAMGVKRTSLGDARKADLSDEPANNVTPFSSKPKNIIMITVESLSAELIDSYGAEKVVKKGLTPELDKLGKAGMRFDRMFATGTSTVSGLEALSLGAPPIPGQAIVRRPAHDHLSTMGELLKHQGFDTFFFYGGFGNFDNMSAYYAANNYRVVDRADIPKSKVGFENAGGVADEYLFEHVIRTLDDKSEKGMIKGTEKGTEKGAEEKPFFVQIMTTSNQRPYTYPSNRIDIPSPGGRAGAVKYTDYAIGKFVKDASKKSWFKDTLFVIVADHGASAAGETRLPVTGYHIPLIFYAPALLKPAVFSPVVSQIDIAPTLLEVLGKNGSAQFFGRSFFEPGLAQQRAFISNYQALGYLKDNILTVLLPKQVVESYQVDPKTLATAPAPVNTQLRDEAIAYYQTASKAFKTGELKAPFYDNPKAKTDGGKPFQTP